MKRLVGSRLICSFIHLRPVWETSSELYCLLWMIQLTFRFLYIDLFVIIPIAVASEPAIFRLGGYTDYPVGRTLPYPKIHYKRPTASLVSRKVLTSIIGQIVINSLIQIVVFIWVRRQPW